MSNVMKTIVIGVFALFCAFGAVCLAEQAQAATGQPEVTERLELNAATVDQIVALGVVSKEEAAKIVELREQLGGLQAYEDLEELGISKAKIDALRPLTTVNYMATDCNC